MCMVKGKTIDSKTRCEHYYSEKDIIAIKFKCCDTYYPCFECHQEFTNHKSQVWKKNEFETLAILCGNCKQEISIQAYMQSNHQCPNCQASFNPNCSKHYHLYFEI